MIDYITTFLKFVIRITKSDLEHVFKFICPIFEPNSQNTLCRHQPEKPFQKIET